MKSISGAAQTILEGDQVILADCYAFKLVGGGTAYVTAYDMPLVLGGNTYQTNPIIKRGTIQQKIGTEVSNLQLTMYPASTDLLDGEPWLQAMRQGQLDGATVLLNRAIMSSPGDTSAGSVLMFSGRVGDVKIGRTSADITVNSWLELLTIQMPRNQYQSPCMWTLYDTGCGVNKASYTHSASVIASTPGPAANSFYMPLYSTNAYFQLGTLQFTSGANEGLSRSISYTANNPPAGTYLQFLSPFPNAPAVGDTFNIWPGCDKTISTCANKFDNLGRHCGFPFIPQPNTAV